MDQSENLESSVVGWLKRGLLMDNPQLGHFFGARKYLGGELDSPVVEWLNKGLMAAWGPTRAHLHTVGERFSLHQAAEAALLGDIIIGHFDGLIIGHFDGLVIILLLILLWLHLLARLNACHGHVPRTVTVDDRMLVYLSFGNDKSSIQNISYDSVSPRTACADTHRG
eukprot:9488960-Pyramimonas_sp.AAC.1